MEEIDPRGKGPDLPPDFGDLTPESDVGELEIPAAADPADTPEPDSVAEVVAATVGTDEQASIDAGIASVPKSYWADPAEWMGAP